MNKKKKPSSKKSESTPQNIVPLPGLGGPPPDEMPTLGEVPPTEFDRFEMERVMGAISKLVEDQDFDSDEEMNEFLEQHLTGQAFEDILAQVPVTPYDEAMEYVYDAIEAESDDDAAKCLKNALEIEPYCLDALMMMASMESESYPGLVREYRKIQAQLEEHFGDEFMDEHKGHFWGLAETRPYMRLRHEIVVELVMLEQFEEAARECEAMLELNPNDNQGIRDILRELYLSNRKFERLRNLNKEYNETGLATALWSAVLERYLSGDMDNAKKLVSIAQKQNKHVKNYMNGKKTIPLDRPEYINLGEQNEAVACVQLYRRILDSNPDFQTWLRKV